MLKTPPLQTATATIDTLCGRLQSATLLEDRRAAILGLRSFAKQYPASVASGSLRELITTLRRDGLGEAASPKAKGEQAAAAEGGDVDTIRLVLETLLMLFNPDSSSPEASEEIAFFMADEFSMRQDNISLLLSLLDPTSPYADYYSRLYSVQILSAICAARPERLQESILNAPLGTSRLVGVLDDGRDAVRNAGLLLLVDLTGGANEDLRKIVAFEDVFGKIFALVRLEGGLADAGIAGQDCLSLLANLVRGSASNQTMFRESGCVAQFVQLLREIFPPATAEAGFIAETREKAGWGVLQLLRLFLTRGENRTAQNQHAFFRAGAAQILLDLAFHTRLPTPLQVSAMKAVADLIANNPPLQEQFAALQVAITSPDEPAQPSPAQTNGSKSAAASARNSARPSVEKPRTYIIEALLDLTLDQSRAEISLRTASCALIQAYLAKHDRIKAHFLQRAIMGHHNNEEAANVLIALLHPSDRDGSSAVFASWIVQDLIANTYDAKKALASVKEGNESEGEDVLTAIQAFGSQLEGALQTGADARIIAAYACTLTVFLWEFAEGIDDLLAEASGLVRALVACAGSAVTDPTTSGLAAALLGTIYEYSTKDSPIPRRTIAPLLTQNLGRGKYLDALLNLRRDPVIRDFGIEDIDSDVDAVNDAFVELFMSEYSRLRKAIDKDPGVEVLPISAAEAGVDRDVLDDLRQQIQSTKDALAQAQQDALESSQQAEQDKLGLSKEAQTAKAEVERLRRINQAMQQGHEEDSQKTTSQHQREKENLNLSHARELANIRQEADRQARQAREQQEKGFGSRVQEYERRYVELGNAHRTEQSGHSSARQQLEALGAQHAQVKQQHADASRQLQASSASYAELEQAHRQLQTRSGQAENELVSLRQSMDERGTEIQGLQAQVKELREELQGKEAELATERAGFAELESELDSAKAYAEKVKSEIAESKKAAEVAEERVIALEKEVEEAKKSLAAAEQELTTARADAKAALDAAKSDLEKTETELEAAKAELDTARSDLETAKSDLEAANSKEVASAPSKKSAPATKDSSKADKAKTEKLEALSKSLATKVKDLQASLTAAEAARDKAVSDLEAATASSSAASKSSQADLDAAQSKLEASTSELVSLKKDVETLKAGLEEAKGSEKAAKEELESLLLVMGEIEGKRDEYKGKVRELGGEVSEDEDNEDEDEDEEEGSEDGDTTLD